MPTRVVETTDVPSCAALFVKTFEALPWDEKWTTNDAEQRLNDMVGTPRSEGRVCLDLDRELVGFALGCRERFQDTNHFFLQEMCVRPDQQRRGWGAALLNALHGDLAGVSAWSLLTARESAASAFYQRHGYRTASRIGFFVRP